MSKDIWATVISPAGTSISSYLPSLPPALSQWGARCVASMKDAENSLKSGSPIIQYGVFVAALGIARFFADILKSRVLFKTSWFQEIPVSNVELLRKKERLAHALATFAQEALFYCCASFIRTRLGFSHSDQLQKIFCAGRVLYDIYTFTGHNSPRPGIITPPSDPLLLPPGPSPSKSAQVPAISKRKKKKKMKQEKHFEGIAAQLHSPCVDLPASRTGKNIFENLEVYY